MAVLEIEAIAEAVHGQDDGRCTSGETEQVAQAPAAPAPAQPRLQPVDLPNGMTFIPAEGEAGLRGEGRLVYTVQTPSPEPRVEKWGPHWYEEPGVAYPVGGALGLIAGGILVAALLSD